MITELTHPEQYKYAAKLLRKKHPKDPEVAATAALLEQNRLQDHILIAGYKVPYTIWAEVEYEDYGPFSWLEVHLDIGDGCSKTVIEISIAQYNTLVKKGTNK